MIRYHGTPMYPATNMATAFIGKHAMVSFEAPEQIEVAAEVCQSVVLDNGAFSAWKAGRTYDFDGYAQWAEKWLAHPGVTWAVIPDVINGSEQENDDLLAAWSLPETLSVPVWHMHESVERLERLMDYPRVALGSSGEFATIGTGKWWKRMAEAMEVACDENGLPRVKLHGLRMLDPGVFSKLPLASADSCSVARNVGLDTRWKSALLPSNRTLRAQILMDRIETHATCAQWNADNIKLYQNFELLG